MGRQKVKLRRGRGAQKVNNCDGKRAPKKEGARIIVADPALFLDGIALLKYLCLFTKRDVKILKRERPFPTD